MLRQTTAVVLLASSIVQAFLPAPSVETAFSVHYDENQRHHYRTAYVPEPRTAPHVSSSSQSPTALGVWWFGGSDGDKVEEGADSCELVAVRIERPTPNSRRIFGDIYIEDATVDDCWAILTDYNRLSTHVPNVVDSKVVSSNSRGEPGDGSYTCRLYQKGAQKIIGFEFGADVTMEMKEQVRMPMVNGAIGDASRSRSKSSLLLSDAASPTNRKIGFKCVDSFFFSVFDGEWTVQQVRGDNDEPITKLSYSVLVQPKGPVPVAALEWRIREDVPTNLRAVKAAATSVGRAGVMEYRQKQQQQRQRRRIPQRANGSTPTANGQQQRRPRAVQDFMGRVGTVTSARTASAKSDLRQNPRMSRVRVKWDADETMARYLKDQ